MFFSVVRSLACFMAVSVLGLGISGCGSQPRSGIPRSDVVLTLSDGEKPLTVGIVDLNNSDTGEGGGGAIDATGVVKIQGVAHGEYIVTILPPSPEGPEGKLPANAKDFKVSKKFSSTKTSPLKVVVDEKNNTFDLKVAE
jgi:hypothetical protein